MRGYGALRACRHHFDAGISMLAADERAYGGLPPRQLTIACRGQRMPRLPFYATRRGLRDYRHAGRR